MAYYLPGMEPERIKIRIQTLFDKLDSAYPDKIIVGLHNDHKKWGETVTKLYRELGYPDGKSFLEAYGYQYKTKEYSGGRPQSVDAEAVIRDLQRKYPNGSPYTQITELFAANPEYLPKLKTIANTSNATFGMPLGQYLKSIGLLQAKAPKTKLSQPKANPVKKNDYTVCMVSPVGTNISQYYISTQKSVHVGDHVEIPIGLYSCPVFGNVEEVVKCDEDTVPCEIEKTKEIMRKVGSREYSDKLLCSILHAWAAVNTDELIKCSSEKPFHPIQTSDIQPNGTIPWACIRGISLQVITVLDYLISKDNQIYEYADIILMDGGVSELYVYADDVIDIMQRFPDVKIAMFAERKDNSTVGLYYSRSGYPKITDGYEIGDCDFTSDSKWTVRHSPTEDFSVEEINYKFKFSDDWNATNYVFSDENASGKQLGK